MNSLSVWSALALTTIAVGALGALWVWNQMSKPRYHPGNLGAKTVAPVTEQKHKQPQQEDETSKHTDGGFTQKQKDENYWHTDDGVSLYHFTAGTHDGVPVLYVHGGPGHPPKSVPKAFQFMQFQFHIYHARGCGNSSRPIERFDNPSGRNWNQNAKLLLEKLGMEAHVLDIERIRLALGVSKLFIIGHSFGGFIAAMYAVEFPQNVQALVLVSPANVLVNEGDGLFGIVRARLPKDEVPKYDQFMKRYLDFSPGLFQKTEQQMRDANNELSGWITRAINWEELSENEKKMTGGFMTHAIYLSIGKQRDYRPAIQKIKAPVLVCHGEDDVIQSKEASWMYSKNIQFSSQHLFSTTKCGHNAFDECPEEFANVVSKFLKQHSSE